MIRDYYERMGIEVVANITGDGRVADIERAHGAALNVVQCSGSTMQLANMMEEKYGIPSLRVSYFGIEDMAEALYDIARFFKDPEMMERTKKIVEDEVETTGRGSGALSQGPGRQEGGHLRRRLVQGLFPGQGLPPDRHAGGHGRLARPAPRKITRNWRRSPIPAPSLSTTPTRWS